jgi:hypothetical protein
MYLTERRLEGVDWIHLVQVRDQLQALVKWNAPYQVSHELGAQSHALFP